MSACQCVCTHERVYMHVRVCVCACVRVRICTCKPESESSSISLWMERGHMKAHEVLVHEVVRIVPPTILVCVYVCRQSTRVCVRVALKTCANGAGNGSEPSVNTERNPEWQVKVVLSQSQEHAWHVRASEAYLRQNVPIASPA